MVFFLYVNEYCITWMQKEVVYGLTEVLREEIKSARLVANPGCYPTSIQLPLVPLIKVCIHYPVFTLYCMSYRSLSPKRQLGKLLGSVFESLC